MDVNEENSDSVAIEVIIPGDVQTAPCCPHGPTLLFEKTCRGGQEGRRFFACSACRDRKDCNFFQWEDEKVSEVRLQAREAQNRSKKPPFRQEEFCRRLEKFTSLPDKKFCQDCQLLLLPAEHGAHSTHSTAAVTAAQLRRPSVLLRPLDNKKSNAQYLFTDRSAGFLLDALAALGFRKVLCVGTPRLQELIQLRNRDQNHDPMTSLLLDIDFRYAQFYGPDRFCHYNMFNHHFFAGESSVAVLDNFLTELDGEKVVLVADPPFGGLVKPLANSFTLISQRWRKLQSSGDGDMPTMWIFPYFFEPRILECLPSFTMLDYQVDYDNHPLYKHGKTGRKQSPVRVFTNLSPRDIVLPAEDGYRFCSPCDRYVSSLNRHCPRCGRCPSKDGREWKHCSSCDRCVKPSWRHCPSCGRCALPDHPCGPGQTEDGCFTCGSVKHKRRGCPLRNARRVARPGAKRAAGKVSHHPLQLRAKRKSGAARRARRSSAPSE